MGVCAVPALDPGHLEQLAVSTCALKALDSRHVP
jgi:hypothetical protein